MTELGPITEAEKLREERDAALERVAVLEDRCSRVLRAADEAEVALGRVGVEMLFAPEVDGVRWVER